MRGEYFAASAAHAIDLGSSPHAWGILCPDMQNRSKWRFIPTCVGNTTEYQRKSGSYAVHPHMRGEYYSYQEKIKEPSGSSPHAWGIRTPIYLASAGRAVHPHMRGEYGGYGLCVVACGGSSPHAWGLLFVELNLYSCTRFIPTCVGNTIWRTLAGWITPVHPHMRGEYSLAFRLDKFGCGSSPHAWGIPFRRAHLRCAYRFIPTCVGNTLWPL